MLHRFLTLSQIPEIRTEPTNTKGVSGNIEILVPVEIFWQMEELIQELKFLKSAGLSTTRLRTKLRGLIKPYIINERDRVTLKRSVAAA